MTSIWVAEHGWVGLNAMIDCCTREIVGWDISLRCRAKEAIAVIEQAVAGQAIAPDTLTIATDNGSAFTARATRAVLSGLGVAHRRGGYRDPRARRSSNRGSPSSSSALIWRMEFETLDKLRTALAAHIDSYHDRPHSRLDYRTPKEVRQTCDDAQQSPHKSAA